MFGLNSKQSAIHCSFCDSTNVNLLSPFGTAQLVSQHYCNSCHSVFEYIRWQNPEDEQKEV
ncbi:PaaD-like zinc ribbon domain-containing protein [Priestia abyssalis]